MKLSVKERIQLMDILPKEGNYLNLKIIDEFRMKLGFTEEEHVMYRFKTMGQLMTWDEKLAEKRGPIEIEVGEVVNKIIREAFRDLDRQNRLRIDMVSLYERFVL